jgi:hypothetical protein
LKNQKIVENSKNSFQLRLLSDIYSIFLIRNRL